MCLDGLEVRPVAVRSELDGTGDTPRQVGDEHRGILDRARHQLGIRIIGCPGPYVAVPELALMLRRDVLVVWR
jgi:hypothetical protein